MKKNPRLLSSICSNSRMLDLSLYDINKPCPHCGTIVKQIIDKPISVIHKEYKRQKKQFELCAVCCQLLTYRNPNE